MGSLFRDTRGRLRAGWRLLLFIAVLFALGAIFSAPLGALFPGLAGLEPTAEPGPETNRLMLYLDGYLLLPLLLASWLMVRYVDRRPFASLGLALQAGVKRELLQGLALGFGMGLAFLALGLLSGAVRFRLSLHPSPASRLGGLGLVLIGLALAALFEELLFHGYLFQTMLEGIGIYPALFVISVVFGLFHRANPRVTLLGLINIALAGLLFALGYLKTRALWLPVAAHFSWNLSLVLCGFRVSGLDFGPGLLEPEIHGAEALTGGAFGPEGGIITTVILTAAIAFVYLSRAIKARPEMAELWREHLRPAFGKMEL